LNKFALISVSDKQNIVKLASELTKRNYTILATGNTAKALSDGGIAVKEVSDFTGFPEIFSGRVKTLHPKISGGILMRRDNPADKSEADANAISPIDIVCVNLYPFKKITENPEIDTETAVENIDIGGPTLIRAAAKNHKFVSVLTNPAQYDDFIAELGHGEISQDFRKKLAFEAFSYTADYDTYISNFFEKRFKQNREGIRISYHAEQTLRYGENPHQTAEIYGDFFNYFQVLHGKELSYNNILDLISAVELVEDLGPNSCSIIKHQNPAGAATAENLIEAYKNALKCDPVSAFGGIVAFTSGINVELANLLNELFLEVISAPDYSEEAIEILQKKKNRRLVKQLKPILSSGSNFKTIPGGVIRQDSDSVDLIEDQLKVVTEIKPSEKEIQDLRFAWKIAKHTKSNSIVFVKDKATVGVGAGQMSRLDSVKIAVMKAAEHGLELKNSVGASDAFFPFPDAMLEMVKAGAKSIIQPGGSVRDEEVIDAANKNKISMVLTGIRHFKH
jgi:phosphoribosylaminoimidazolecarboxamide formyltransferase / IMP cyclohydrolase